MMKIILALLLAAIPASAQYSKGPTISTNTGTMSQSLAGYYYVAASSRTVSTPTITLNGTTGVILSSGIGIGTSNPNNALEVVGSINMSRGHFGVNGGSSTFIAAGSAPQYSIGISSDNGSAVNFYMWLGLAPLGNLVFKNNSGVNVSTLTQSGAITFTSSVTASAFFGDASHLSGIPSTTSISGFYVANAGGTMTGALNMNNVAHNFTGVNGNLVSQASVTASAFFGDGSHLAGISGTVSGGTVNAIPYFVTASTIGSSQIIRDNSGSITVVGATVTFQMGGGAPVATRTIISTTAISPSANVSGGIYTPPTNVRQIKVRMVGAGGGGGAMVTNSGTRGGNSYFGIYVSSGGRGGFGGNAGGASGNGGSGGLGGGVESAVTVSSVAIVVWGNAGSGAASAANIGGSGGGSFFGGAGNAGADSLGGSDAADPFGSGGGGGSTSGGSTGGGGGGSGAYAELTLGPAAYRVIVGTAGVGGINTHSGGSGGGGIIIIEEIY